MRPSPLARNVLLLSCALAAASPALADPADRLVVLLPGQTLDEGMPSGPANAVPQHEPFTVHVVAVDANGNVDADYGGPIAGLATGEASPSPALRMATSISAPGAATAIAAGSELRLSINGEEFRDYEIGAAATGGEVCQSIEDAVRGPEPDSYAQGLFFSCSFDAGSSRYVLTSGDHLPARTNIDEHYPENSVRVDPDHGVAPILHFGGQPGASEFVARRLVAAPAIDLVFDRGWASFRATWVDLDDSGPGKTVVVDQGGGQGLPVFATPFEVQPAPFAAIGATALGDGNGGIDRVRLTLDRELDPSTLAGQESAFSLEELGMPPIPGTAIGIVEDAPLPFAHHAIEVTFGSGIGKTDVTDVKVVYTPPATGGLTSTAGVPFGSTVPSLVDGAPPVLVGTTALDTDGNGGLDVLRLVFSEPIRFSGGRGVSLSAYGPATESETPSLSVPASLRLVLDGVEETVSVVDPDQPAAGTIEGGAEIARALTYAVRSALPHPAYASFTAEFLDARRRLVLVPGTVGDGSDITVLPAAGSDAAVDLKLGPVNGGQERPGFASEIGDLDDFIVLSEEGTNLLAGQEATALSAVGSQVDVALTNAPGSGTATPTFLWKDSGDLGFLSDRAPRPNRAAAANSAGLPPAFHPTELLRIRDDDTNPADGVLTSNPGTLVLDASDSVPPLLATHDPDMVTFDWRQVSGPFAAAILPPDELEATTDLLLAGDYEFELVVTALDALGAPVFSADLTAEGTLTRRVPAVIVPGPPARMVIVLPNQTLRQGVAAYGEAIEGGPHLATPNVPFEVRVICTDAFFNVVTCPAGDVALDSTEPGAVAAPPVQPLAGSEVAFSLLPETPGDWLLDDVLGGVGETDDVPSPYATGTAWNAVAAKLPGLPATIRLTWDADPRPVQWNVYSGSLPLADLDADGLPDGGYGACASAADPDPHDTVFEDPTAPAPGTGLFYVGTMTLGGQETVAGTTSSGLVRAPAQACP
jgi:hypothetical protein